MKITDAQKQLISDKLNKALFTETLSITEAAHNLGINVTYASMIRNPKQWVKCSIAAWEAANGWVNSGQKLSEYSVAHARVSMAQADIAEVKDELKQMPREAKKKMLSEIKEAVEEQEAARIKKVADELYEPLGHSIKVPVLTDTARMKVALDIEINLVVNGQKVQVR